MKQKRRISMWKLYLLFCGVALLGTTNLSAADYITMGSGKVDEVTWGLLTWDNTITGVTGTANSPTLTGTGIGTKVAVGDMLFANSNNNNLWGYVAAIPDDNTITLGANTLYTGAAQTLKKIVITATENKPVAGDNVYVNAGHTLTVDVEKTYASIQVLSGAEAGKLVVTTGGNLTTTTTNDDNGITTRVFGAFGAGNETQLVIEGTGLMTVNGYFTFRPSATGANATLLVKDQGKLITNRNLAGSNATAVFKFTGTVKSELYGLSGGTLDLTGSTSTVGVKKRFGPSVFTAGQSTIEFMEYSEDTYIETQNTYTFYNLRVNNTVTYFWGWATSSIIKTLTVNNNLILNNLLAVGWSNWVMGDGAVITTEKGFGPKAGIFKNISGSFTIKSSTPITGAGPVTIPFADGEKYIPVVITGLTPTATNTAEINFMTIPSASSVIVGANSLQRSWDLKSTNVDDFSAQFYYTDDEVIGNIASYVTKILSVGTTVNLTDVTSTINSADKRIELSSVGALNGTLMASASFAADAPDGAYSKANGSWNAAATWAWKGTGSGIPNADDVDVYINNTVTINQNASVRNFTIQPRGFFTANSRVLTIKGKTDIYGLFDRTDNNNGTGVNTNVTTFEGPVTIYKGAYMNTENVYGYSSAASYDAAFQTKSQPLVVFKNDLTVDGELRSGEFYFNGDDKADKTITLRGTGTWIASGGGAKRYLIGAETTVINETSIRFTSSGERYLQSVAGALPNNSKFINKGTVRHSTLATSPYDQTLSSTATQKGTPVTVDFYSYENTIVDENGGDGNLAGMANDGEYWNYIVKINSEIYGRSHRIVNNLKIKGDLIVSGNPIAATTLVYNAANVNVEVGGNVIIENATASFTGTGSLLGCSLTANKIIKENGGTFNLSNVPVLLKADAVGEEPVMKLVGGGNVGSLYLSGAGNKKIVTDNYLTVGNQAWNNAQSDTSNISIASGSLYIDGMVRLTGSSTTSGPDWAGGATNKPYIDANGGKIKINSLQFNTSGGANYPELRNVDLEVDTLKLNFNNNYGRYMLYTGENRLTINHNYFQLYNNSANPPTTGAGEMMNATGSEVIVNGEGPISGTFRFAPNPGGAALPNIKRLVINRTSADTADSVKLYDNVIVGEELVMGGMPVKFMVTNRSITYAGDAKLTYAGNTDQTPGLEFTTAQNLRMNGTAKLKMDRSATLTSLDFVKGIFDANGFDQKITTITGSNFSATNMMELGDKKLTVSAANMTLPIGTDGKFAPVTLSDIVAESGVEVSATVANSAADAYLSDAVRLNKKWEITSSGAFTGKLKFEYDASDITGTVQNGKLEGLYIAGGNVARIGQSTNNKIETDYMGDGLYTAYFMPLYTISMTKGVANPAGPAYEFDQIGIKADDPESGFRFSRWTSNGVVFANAKASETTFNMPAMNVTVTAEYAAIRNVTVTGGTTDKATAVQYEDVTITANTPEIGKLFDKWTGGDDFLTEVERTTSPLTFAMPDKDVALTATYKDGIYYAVLANATSNKPDGAKYNESITITADTPEEGWRFTHWSGNDVALVTDINNPVATFQMPAHDIYLDANFEEITYAITVNGGISNFDLAPAGERIRITAEVPAGKTFIRWESNDGVIFDDPTSEVTRFTMPAKAVTVTAVYWNIGVDETNTERVAVYPNPATNRIQVNGLAENSQYKIVNAAGQQVMAGSDYNGEPIDIGSLAPGSYIFLSGDQTIVFIKK